MLPLQDRRSNRRLASFSASLLAAALLCLGCAGNAAPGLTGETGTYWCVMHPDIRGQRGGKCPLCGMELVRASTADYRPYSLDLSLTPEPPQPNTNTKIRLTIQDPDGNRVRRLETLHERLLHLFVVSYDLEFFTHVHPVVRADGSLDVDIVLPRPGPYRLIADFLPTGGPPQLIEKSVITSGYDGPLAPPSSASTDLEDKVANGTRVRMYSPPSLAGREQLVTFELSDDVTGKPVVDLEPYLAATGHLFVIGADLDRAFHSHPVAEVSSRLGPDVVFQMIFGREGVYKLWFQFQRNGQVATVSFILPVSPAQGRSASSNVARQFGPVESILKRPPAEMETGLRSRSMGR